MKKIVIIVIAILSLFLLEKHNNFHLQEVSSNEIMILNNDGLDNLVINRGKDSLEEGDIVMSKGYLVGMVTEVRKNDSTVTLITNSRNKLSIKIGEFYGIISAYENNYLIVDNVKEKEVKVGDEAFTSGINYIYPPDILVGKVKGMFKENGIAKIILETKVDFNNIKNLEILKR